jgi:putative DNA primase/helicase
LVDIPVDKIVDSAEDADRMKAACASYFGTAGPAFIQKLIEDLENLYDQLKRLDDIATTIGKASTNEEKRVRKRFALCALAGELAIVADILPWDRGTALTACKHVYGLWKNNSSVVSDAQRGINNVRSFILKHGASRFEAEPERTIYNRAGWHRDEMYHFTPEGFREACGGVLDTVVKKALYEAGLLHTSDEPGRLRSSIRVDGVTTHVISVLESILEDAEPTAPTSDAKAGAAETSVNAGATPAAPIAPSQISNASKGVHA